jgi:hypothetical protein
MVVSMWKKSGNHDNDLPTKPISDFTEKYIIRYFHEFVHGQPDVLSRVLKDLEEGVFSESTNSNSRKRKGGPNRRNHKAVSTTAQDEVFGEIASSQKARNKTMAELARSQKETQASQKVVNASQDVLNKYKAVTDAENRMTAAEDRIGQMRADRRARIEAIGGKEKLMKLRNGESQNSCCDEIADLEERIKSTVLRLAVYREALAKAMDAINAITPQPPASPSA